MSGRAYLSIEVFHRIARGELRALGALDVDGDEANPIATLPQQIRRRLRELIKQGAFRPGEPLTIRALARQFGVSPTPVREALQQLTAEGLLEASPNRSFRLMEMTPDRFADISEVRVTLEGMAAERAAARIGAKALADLQILDKAMEWALAERRMDLYLRGNEAFHFTIYREAESPTLLQMIDGLWVMVGPYLRRLFLEGRTVTVHYHGPILEALAVGNGRAAAAAIRNDILAAGPFMRGVRSG